MQTDVHRSTAEPLDKNGCILPHILCRMLC